VTTYPIIQRRAAAQRTVKTAPASKTKRCQYRLRPNARGLSVLPSSGDEPLAMRKTCDTPRLQRKVFVGQSLPTSLGNLNGYREFDLLFRTVRRLTCIISIRGELSANQNQDTWPDAVHTRARPALSGRCRSNACRALLGCVHVGVSERDQRACVDHGNSFRSRERRRLITSCRNRLLTGGRGGASRRADATSLRVPLDLEPYARFNR
jgi:hypothetical protein